MVKKAPLVTVIKEYSVELGVLAGLQAKHDLVPRKKGFLELQDYRDLKVLLAVHLGVVMTSYPKGFLNLFLAHRHDFLETILGTKVVNLVTKEVEVLDRHILWVM